METKHLSAPFQIKELGANGYVAGYASVFGTVDSQQEAVAKGAFSRSLKEWTKAGRTPAMLWMHDVGQPVGVWENVREDAHGLVVEGSLAIKTQGGADAYEFLKMGAVTGLSIGYRTVASRAIPGSKARLLTDVDLYEVSLVTFPANTHARVQAVKTPFAHSISSTPGSEMRAIAARLRAMAQFLKD